MNNSGRGSTGNLDFTLEKYEKLCQALAKSIYTSVTFAEYFTHHEGIEGHFVILRHDVDEDCRYALDLALIEKRYNLKSTYYFRLKKRTYVPAVIDKIAHCNHEIGYHYETVDKCRGDIEAAAGQFRNELSVLRERYPIKTACMHGNPLTRFDNKDLWKNNHLADFGLIGEPYISLNYSLFSYFSDSGRTWGSDTWRKTKDNVSASTAIIAKNTDDLIEIINSGKLEHLCILTHPERWPKSTAGYIKRYAIDLAYLAGKTVIRVMRNK